MRAHVLAAWSASAVALGAALVACVDLFHSTADILDLCEVDAQAPACAREAGGPPAEASVDAGGGTDFCAWSHAQARQNAEHACAWLGACESPMGGNAFGACVFQALLAYDCAANPNHRVQGKAHDRWDCLWQARSCADVHACLLPGVSLACNGSTPGTACVSAGTGSGSSDVRVECLAGGTLEAEDCSLWAQSCASDGTQGVCAGGSSPSVACMSQNDSCVNGHLHSCLAGTRDVDLDCTTSGAGACNGFSSPDGGQWVACVPEADAGPCMPSATPACSGSPASLSVGCPAGVYEELDCQALLQAPTGVPSCVPQPGAPAYDWTSACAVTPPLAPCDADGGDFCAGDAGLTGCVRGVPLTIDCVALGLQGCHVVTTDVGTAQHAACSPPP